jgi:hypothetical protein
MGARAVDHDHILKRKNLSATSGGGAGVAASDDFQRGALK